MPKLEGEIGDNELEMPTSHEFDENCFKQADRDELKKHGWQLETVLGALTEIKITAEKNVTGLEARVRSLENFKWIAWGMATVIGILLGYMVQLIAASKH